MVAAHLQGILKPKPQYGLRSEITESILLEAMVAEKNADLMDSEMHRQMAMLPVLNEKGVNQTLDSISARSARLAQLSMMDLFRVEEQLRLKGKLADTEGEISLYQLYQIAEKSGIFDEWKQHEQSRPAQPLL